VPRRIHGQPKSACPISIVLKKAKSATADLIGRRPSRAASRPPQGDGTKISDAVAPLAHDARHPDAVGHSGVHALLRRAASRPLPSHGSSARAVALRGELLPACRRHGMSPYDAAAPLPSVLRRPDVGGHKSARAPLLSAPAAPQKNHGRPAPAAALRAELSLAPQNDGRSLFGAAVRLPRVQRQPEVAAHKRVHARLRRALCAPRRMHGQPKSACPISIALKKTTSVGRHLSKVACRPPHEDGKNVRHRDAAGRPSACRRRAGGDRASLSLSTPFAT
jgi:hypothetical protein